MNGRPPRTGLGSSPSRRNPDAVRTGPVLKWAPRSARGNFRRGRGSLDPGPTGHTPSEPRKVAPRSGRTPGPGAARVPTPRPGRLGPRPVEPRCRLPRLGVVDDSSAPASGQFTAARARFALGVRSGCLFDEGEREGCVAGLQERDRGPISGWARVRILGSSVPSDFISRILPRVRRMSILPSPWKWAISRSPAKKA